MPSPPGNALNASNNVVCKYQRYAGNPQTPSQSYLIPFNVPTYYIVGMKPEESCSCCANDCGKAAMPATMPAAMKTSDMMDQMTPQHCDEPPYRCAKTLASELLTFRRMRSSHCRTTVSMLA
jgi:hypothetical protein